MENFQEGVLAYQGAQLTLLPPRYFFSRHLLSSLHSFLYSVQKVFILGLENPAQCGQPVYRRSIEMRFSNSPTFVATGSREAPDEFPRTTHYANPLRLEFWHTLCPPSTPILPPELQIYRFYLLFPPMSIFSITSWVALEEWPIFFAHSEVPCLHQIPHSSS